jgi:hypothetical protein
MQRVYLQLMPAALLLLPVVGIACGLLMAFRPHLRDVLTRTMLLGAGGLMALERILAGSWEYAGFGLCMIVGAIVSTFDRRVSGVFGGLCMTAIGLWFATAWMRPDDPFFASRHSAFILGEVCVLIGAIMAVGTWQGWFAALENDDEIARSRGPAI